MAYYLLQLAGSGGLASSRASRAEGTSEIDRCSETGDKS